jgi:hypothetical protein
MNTQFAKRCGALAAIIGAAIGLSVILEAAPAMADGDLQGNWKISTAQVSLKPVSGELPFTPHGRELYQSHVAAAAQKNYSFDATVSRCSTPGLPRMMLSPGRFQVLQRSGIILVLYEWNRTFRQIDMRGKPLEPNDVVEPRFVGRSVGHWERDVLVVQSAGFADEALLDNLIPSTSDLELIERFRLNRGQLEDTITITDPEIFTRPWKAVITYTRQPDAILDKEDICLERLKAGLETFPR